MNKEREALKALIHEMEYVLSCINAEEIPFDGDDFHEALRLGKEALDHLAQPEQEKERCVGCEACIDTACGRDECPKGWPKSAQPEQEPFCYVNVNAQGDITRTVKRKDAWCKTPLYTTPPQEQRSCDMRTWVGLSVFEINELVENTEYEDYRDLVERTEDKLKEKNT